MIYLIDRDWVIDALRARPNAVSLIERLTVRGIAISVITYGEVMEGIYFGRERMRSRRGFRDFLREAPVIPLSRPIMHRAARISGQLRRTGLWIGDMDTLIAATALYHRLTLVTRNTREFQRVLGLTLLDA